MTKYTDQDNPYSTHTQEPTELTLEGQERLPWLEPESPASPAVRKMSRFDTAQGSYGKANEPRAITVAELFDEIRSDRHKAICAFLRSPEYQRQAEALDTQHAALIEKRSATQDSAERAQIDAERDQVKQALTHLKAGKHKLPAVTFSTICKGGHGLKNAVSHTGIYQVDLDLKDNPALADEASRAKIKRTLSVDSRVLGFFDSPSNGLKVLVLVNSQSLDKREHEHAWKLANDYVCEQCGFNLKYDDACKNPTRLCFLSHDPDAQLDELAVPLEYTEPTEPAHEEPRRAHELQQPPQASGSSAGLKPMEAYNQSSDFEELLRQLGATKTKCGGWLRAGGTSPRSASWSGKSLHVFSDSFTPFEQNTNYTPADVFAVCVLGLRGADEDQSGVVRALSKLGYGEQRSTGLSYQGGVDTSLVADFVQNFTQPAEEDAGEDRPSVDDLLSGMVASTPGRIDELRKRAQDAVFVLPQIALAGELTILNAQYNTGKTLLTLWLLKNRDMEATKHLDIYYINADDSFNGSLDKMAWTRDFGVHTLIPNQYGFSLQIFRAILQQSIREGRAANKVFVLDTLKKFVSTMDKKGAAEFNGLVRTFTQAGGTLIALAHTNKNKGADGKSVAEGVGDFHSDFDNAYTIEKSGAIGEAVSDRTIVFENGKMRGPVAQKVTFCYDAGEGRTWKQRFDSIKCLSENDAIAAEKKARAKAQMVEDQPIIAFILDELKSGEKSHTYLRKEKPSGCTGEPTGSRAAREAVLYRYDQRNSDPDLRLWNTSKGDKGGIYYRAN